MDTRLRELLAGQCGNYILPFFWQSGEPEDIIRGEIARIHESGIGAVCVESRPHPDFAGPQWWKDMDVVMEEARQRGMRVWVLDDAHFPTGFANGWIRDKFPEKGKHYLAERHVDTRGPFPNASFLVMSFLNQPDFMNPGAAPPNDDRLLAVIASKRAGQGEAVDDTLLDLTGFVTDGVLRWDVPEGFWRIFILFTTNRGGGNPDYINPIDAESVRVLIDAVYEPHFSHYGADFGKTFAGFFSDEPGMGNTKGYAFDESIGRKRMPLPWSAEMSGLMAGALGSDYHRYLPCLWYDAGNKTALIRHRYMDIVTGLYAKNFSGQLGNWCRGRGVEYIGHVIEDQSVHARLGAGAGHFFRALGGQDMSGVDVVIQQILPGFDSVGPDYFGGAWDGEFFHYGLAKLASSLGHIDPGKQGRTMCEIFGAYGWMEGLKLMKWLADHMLARGVNWFVPHAFSSRQYPDHDCPPHFYARGHNPQFRYFRLLMNYMNRMCHMLNGGRHIATAALLYHADAEWCGEYMPFQKPARVMMQNQIDFDVVPADAFGNPALFDTRISDGKLIINGEEYGCLVIPYGQYVTAALSRFVLHALDCRLNVLFAGGLPEGICDAQGNEAEQLMAGLRLCQTASIEDIPALLRGEGLYDISVDWPCPYLRHYHYQRDGSEIFMFFNEHPHYAVCCGVRLKTGGRLYRYDPFLNKLSPYDYGEHGLGSAFNLELAAYESIVLVQGEAGDVPVEPTVRCSAILTTVEIAGPWRLSLASATEYPAFKQERELDRLQDLSRPELYPRFSGTMRYEGDFILDNAAGGADLDLGGAYETAEIWINGKHAGTKLCPPYRFDVGGMLKAGRNRLRIDVTNTPVRELRDFMSSFSALEPCGLMGPVKLIMYE